jgi:16S rRNA (cytidine1402-2'-O)-methyltransferase
MSFKLYLVPNTITEDSQSDSLAPAVAKAIEHIRLFFVEEPKSARALLKKLNPAFPLTECQYVPLNEHTSIKDIEQYFDGSKDAAIISEAGYPCVADPGADLVRLAHQKGVQVTPLVGASSIILALAASGLGGQNFAFNGYLPKDKEERLKKIKALEERSAKEGQTQIIMETPYRNQSLLEDFLGVCHHKTLLCVASAITGPSQVIKTASIGDWKKSVIKLEKNPALFIINTSL